MYSEAIKRAFRLFPLEPPGDLQPGQYGRVRSQGQFLHYGDLGSALGLKIETSEVSHELEYFGEGVSRFSLASSVPGISKARVSFADRPSLYLRGKRTSLRIKNFDSVLAGLSRVGREWNWRNRIIVETMYVESADIICGQSSKAAVDVRYDDFGLALPVDLAAGASEQRDGLLRLPDTTGVIAYGAVRLVFGHVIGASASPLRRTSFKSLDALNPEDSVDCFDDK